jgi:hypothetical protein
MNIKNAIKGIFIAILAASTFTVLLAAPFCLGKPDFLFTIVGWGLLFTSWFVIPIGAIFGMLIPKIAAGKTPTQAAKWGVLPGIGLGAVGSFVLNFYSFSSHCHIPNSVWTDFWKTVCFCGTVMAIYHIVAPELAAKIGVWRKIGLGAIGTSLALFYFNVLPLISRCVPYNERTGFWELWLVFATVTGIYCSIWTASYSYVCAKRALATVSADSPNQ